jgi:ElaB/YqjD/DUF883 family membrane-anchored ribosome-binding protein
MDEATNGMTNESTQPPMGAGNGEPVGSAKEDLKAALNNLTSALNKFAAAAGPKAREEWNQAKPEIQKALAEMKRAVEAGTQKASSGIDSLSKKMGSNKSAGDGGTVSPEATPDNPSGWGDGTPQN